MESPKALFLILNKVALNPVVNVAQFNILKFMLEVNVKRSPSSPFILDLSFA